MTVFNLALRDRVLLRHTPDAPCLFAGLGTATMAMLHGNFDIEDRLEERCALRHLVVEGDVLHFHRDAAGPAWLSFRLHIEGDAARLDLIDSLPDLNRVWLRMHAEPDEQVWGCGEQMSYFNLRGRRFPLWTSEPGVGRDKTTEITWRADVAGRAGGDYYTTNYPQPSFLTARRLFVHIDTTAYSVFDFRAAGYHELEIWEPPQRIEFGAAADFPTLVGAVSTRFGRQPPLPDWVLNGAIIGLKDGAASFDRLETFRKADVAISALWCEDWAGIRQTSFGTRLFWNWHWNAARHPELPARIASLRAQGIRFMGYVSPYLCSDGTLFTQAEMLGLLARRQGGGTYLVDFGEFTCGVLDFTNPAAITWFQQTILIGNMLELGLSGWMADFGDYLPIDVVLHNGVSAELMHNAWPPLWASVNAGAVAGTDALFFMRAGFTGSQAVCPLLWAGDQCVDFSRHDGLQTVICGALSAGLLGNAYHHSDIGGYTSLFGNVRTPELIIRWAEMAAFTPVMRSHEGNRPRENLQIDQDPDVLAHFARMTRVYRHLGPYLRHLMDQATTAGLPLQRPLFLHHEDDAATYDIQDQYLYGTDLLVAPVHAAGAMEWSVYLPLGAIWRHVWTGTEYQGGLRVTVSAPLGQPPVFARVDSAFGALFAELANIS